MTALSHNILGDAPPRAFAGRTAVFAARTRVSLEDEFMRLYALRDEISGTLWLMTRTLKRLETRNAGGARG